MKTPILLLIAQILLAATALAKDPKTQDAAGGQKVVREYYETGIIKLIKRYDSNGKLIGVLHHNSKGVALYAEMYDGDRLAGKIYYYPNGNPRLTEHYDTNGVTRLTQEFDENNKLLSSKTYDGAGKLLKEEKLRSSLSKRWSEPPPGPRSHPT